MWVAHIFPVADSKRAQMDHSDLPMTAFLSSAAQRPWFSDNGVLHKWLANVKDKPPGMSMAEAGRVKIRYPK